MSFLILPVSHGNLFLFEVFFDGTSALMILFIPSRSLHYLSSTEQLSMLSTVSLRAVSFCLILSMSALLNI